MIDPSGAILSKATYFVTLSLLCDDTTGMRGWVACRSCYGCLKASLLPSKAEAARFVNCLVSEGVFRIVSERLEKRGGGQKFVPMMQSLSLGPAANDVLAGRKAITFAVVCASELCIVAVLILEPVDNHMRRNYLRSRKGCSRFFPPERQPQGPPGPSAKVHCHLPQFRSITHVSH
jgi:hypothetical protein